MVISPIASAVAPIAVNSATNDDGLLNKLFKIAVLVSILIFLVLSYFIISLLIDISDLLGGLWTAGFNVVRFVFPPVNILFTTFGALSAFAGSFLFGKR